MKDRAVGALERRNSPTRLRSSLMLRMGWVIAPEIQTAMATPSQKDCAHHKGVPGRPSDRPINLFNGQDYGEEPPSPPSNLKSSDVRDNRIRTDCLSEFQ